MVSEAQKQQFIETNLPYAQQTSADTGLPTDYVLGWAAEESGWGTSTAATQGNNYFGISPGGTLASYDSQAGGYSALTDLVNSGSYSGVAGTSSDPYTLASGYAAAGYNSADPDYASNVAGATSSVDTEMSALGLSDDAGGDNAEADPNNPDFQPMTPLIGSPIGPGSSGGSSGSSGSGGGSSSGGWVADIEAEAGELFIRAALMLVGLILIASGFYLAGRTGSLGASALNPATVPQRLGRALS